MGCCISKCKPDLKHSLELRHQFNHHRRHDVQDKLVISRAPPPPITLYSSTKHKISPSPPSPTSSSTSSLSSFTRTTTSNTISSSASSFSSASSALVSSNRSFSNEFLWSCYKENPHIARINSLKEASLSLTPRHNRNIINPSPPPKPSTKKYSPPPQNVSFSMPQKRTRSNSPTNLTRQKSLRKEPPVGPIIVNSSASNMNMSTSRTTLGSPSPSRRFIGDKCGSSFATAINNSPKVSVVHSHSVSSSMKKDQCVKLAASPNNNSRRFLHHSGLRHRETCSSLRVGSKIDETVVKDVMSSTDVDATMMEDIDNPLISLDCFIFL